VQQRTTTTVPDRISADGASQSHAWVSLADHTADVVAQTNDLVRELGLGGRPEGSALSEAAPWHDLCKASVRWRFAIERFLTQLRGKVEECRQQEGDPQAQRILDEFAALLTVPRNDHWAKFPDVKWLLSRPDLPTELRKEIRRRLYTPFQPGFRHEAA